MPSTLHAQFQAPSEKLVITAETASTREDGDGSIVEATGHVSIEVDRARLSADSAVIWLPGPAAGSDTQHAQIALIGHASVEQKIARRSGDRLLVGADVKGTIRLTAQPRDPPAERSELYRSADALREAVRLAEAAPGPATAPTAPTSPAPQPLPPRTEPPQARAAAAGAPSERGAAPPVSPVPPPPEPPSPAEESGLATVPPPGGRPIVPTEKPLVPLEDTRTQQLTRSGQIVKPSTQPVSSPIVFQARDIQTAETGAGTVGIVLEGGVTLFQRRAEGDTIELQSERAVLFTTLKSLRELTQRASSRRMTDAVIGAYLEGDVRIVYTSAAYKAGEQRLAAERVYYEFATDRAILTDAVVHTVDVVRQLPFILRAKIVRQLSAGEYRAEKAQLTTSQFALPSYAIAADRMYVRSEAAPGSPGEQQVYVDAKRVTLPVFGTPIFYWPSFTGVLNDQEQALRGLGVENRSSFGFGVETEWGLFPSLGAPAPQDLDVGYRVDYFSERGPAFGLSAAYRGGVVTDTARQPWNFEGDFKAYLVYDKGEDDLGGFRNNVRPNAGQSLRGRVLWEHQHYFPDDWQVQLRAGWVSDATFQEQWFRREYEEDLPLDVSAYLKHQQDTEAFTLLIDAQPSKVVTTSDLAQEQFEVERLPEIGYRRIGDAFLDDRLTFFSDNTADGLHFQQSRSSLQRQGYVPGTTVVPGLPSLGTTGVTDKTVYRGNFRQEVDYPLAAGPLRVVPYGLGILTEYSDSPRHGAESRILVGGGARLSTDFWKVDPAAVSDLFDIHQLRHVITPELNLFSAVENVHRQDVFVYDEPIDAASDISGMQLAVRQKWETKRGGPGQWRNVDAFTFDVDLDLFAHKPPRQFLNPLNFRGLYFPSLPEASVPRNAINANASWRLSDETVMLADMSHNLDKQELATAAIGLLVRRGDRLSYYIENRYVDLLGSNITSIHVDYTLTTKYSIALDQAFDFSFGKNVTSAISVARRFDTFSMTLSVYRDVITNQSGVNFNLSPLGLGPGLGSGAFASGFTR